MSDLNRAIEIAVETHEGMTDKAGEPYILHPLRVMLSVNGASARIAGVLHDVVEDSEWKLEDLRREGFSDEVIAAVDGVTRRDGEDYFQFCERAARHPIARAAKLADLEDNMDLERIAWRERSGRGAAEVCTGVSRGGSLRIGFQPPCGGSAPPPSHCGAPEAEAVP